MLSLQRSRARASKFAIDVESILTQLYKPFRYSYNDILNEKDLLSMIIDAYKQIPVNSEVGLTNRLIDRPVLQTINENKM